MTPVVATHLGVGGANRGRGGAGLASVSRTPCGPVAALAFPDTTTTPRARPS